VNKEFKLPDVGEGLTEADIVTWRVAPGDVVTINQVIVEIETAKSLVELPSPFAGTVTKLLVDEGTTVDVGIPIIAIDDGVSGSSNPELSGGGRVVPDPGPGGERGAEPAGGSTGGSSPRGETVPGAGDGPTPSAPADAPKRQPVLVGYGVRPGATSRRPRRDRSTRPASYPASPSITDAPSAPIAPTAPSVPAPPDLKALAKPPVRRLARDLGVDLTALTGTGPQGTVTRDDVQRAATVAAVRSDERSAAGPGEREERIAVRGVRKHTAAAMVASAFTAPHVTEFLQVDVTESLNAMRRLRELPEFAAVKVSPLLLVARALLTAAARHPMINSSWDEAAHEIVVKRYVNLGIAVATERGLIVPSVKGAHEMSLAELAGSLDELAATARAGKATPADLSGGTITITNVGVFGIDAGTPILTPGEAAILAFGAIRDMPWVVDGQIAVRKVTTLSLSFDHRIVDGELGSAVLRDVGWMLEDPIRMLAWS
jgi:2-oxoisovalerate dehydrogenase E2 component (dihydrolipoyl transacylase)